MRELIPILFSNLYEYDAVIFVIAIINLFILFLTMSKARKLRDRLHPTLKADHILDEASIVDMRKNTSALYVAYVNMTALFPLLGILGTVISLLNMAQDMSNVQMNFFGALTSTFWGLIFAILYKFLDSFPAAIIEDNEKNVAFYLERNHINSNVNKEKVCIKEEK